MKVQPVQNRLYRLKGARKRIESEKGKALRVRQIPSERNIAEVIILAILHFGIGVLGAID